MKTYVVTGGTDGIGRAVALDRLARGDEVVVIGRDPAKAGSFLDAAASRGATERAHFVPADLSLVGEARRVVEEIGRRFDTIDALVLCARHYRSTRLVTAEGLEHNLALFYLSRFVLSYGLLDLLDRAERPVILNIAGPGSGTGEIRWDDLGGERGYHGAHALAQGGQLNDLLGIEFARRRPASRVRYVLLHPGAVRTGHSGEYDAEAAAQVEAMRATAQPVERALVPILDVLANPPAEPLAAIAMGRTLELTGPEFDADAARRLYDVTTRLLGSVAPAAPGVSAGRLRRLLDSPVYATVATVAPDGAPHQSVVWIGRDGDDVLFVIAVGSRKERNLRRDPRVSVLVCPPDQPYTYAAIHGTATLGTEGGHRLRDALAIKYTGRTYAEHNADAAARFGHLPVATVRVTPSKIVGRL
jgi:PPOX class probable F420-dependent enzyme